MCTPPPPAQPAAGQCSPVIMNANLVSNLPPGTTLADANCTGGAACEALCKANTTCNGFTWHDSHQSGYANYCFFTSVAHPWSQYTSQTGHESGLCNHGHGRDSSSSNHKELMFVGHFGPGTPAPAALSEGGTPVQSYGGVLQSPLVWPVPGNGNGQYHTQGYLDPAAGKRRSDGMLGRRRGVAAAPTSGDGPANLYVDYGAGNDSAAGTSATAPLKTIAAAVVKAGTMPAPVVVFLVGTSTHYVADTIKLTAAHSGIAIVGSSGAGAGAGAGADAGARAQSGVDEAVVSGGVAFAGTWTPTGNTSDNKATIYSTPVPKGQ